MFLCLQHIVIFNVSHSLFHFFPIYQPIFCNNCRKMYVLQFAPDQKNDFIHLFFSQCMSNTLFSPFEFARMLCQCVSFGESFSFSLLVIYGVIFDSALLPVFLSACNHWRVYSQCTLIHMGQMRINVAIFLCRR